MSRAEHSGGTGGQSAVVTPSAAWTEAWLRSMDAAARAARQQLVQAMRANTAMTLGMTYAVVGREGETPESGPTVEPVERIPIGEGDSGASERSGVSDPEFDAFLVVHEHVEEGRVLAR